MTEWIEERVSLDYERKIFVVKDSGDTIAKGLTLREAIAVARKRNELVNVVRNRNESVNIAEYGNLVSIEIDEEFAGRIDTGSLILANEKNLRAIEERGFVEVERRV